MPEGDAPGWSACLSAPRIWMDRGRKWRSPGTVAPGPATTVRRSRLHLLGGVPRHGAVVLHHPAHAIAGGRRTRGRRFGRSGRLGLLLAAGTRGKGEHRSEENDLLHLLLLQGVGRPERCRAYAATVVGHTA